MVGAKYFSHFQERDMEIYKLFSKHLKLFKPLYCKNGQKKSEKPWIRHSHLLIWSREDQPFEFLY